MITGLSDDQAIEELAEAKKKGHKFMKIYLHPSKIQRNQKKIIISGAVTLQAVKVGLDQFGGTEYRFVEKRGDSMIFEFDSAEREYVCWLYDDVGRGYFSPVGYNRDLLASHWKEDFFIIKDPEAYADVKLRHDYISENPKATTIDVKSEKAINQHISSGQNVEEIDNQIKFLQQRKTQVIKMDEEHNIELDKRETVYQEKKAAKEKAAKEKGAASKKVSSNKTTQTKKESPSLKNPAEGTLEKVG